MIAQPRLQGNPFERRSVTDDAVHREAMRQGSETLLKRQRALYARTHPDWAMAAAMMGMRA